MEDENRCDGLVLLGGKRDRVIVDLEFVVVKPAVQVR